MAKIPFYLVTGFLGSGKTTLLKRYLDNYSETRKIAIIQNEFAEVNIDSHDLQQTGKSFEILEMNNGSVFCVCLLGDFVHSLKDFIQEHNPEVLILEASGLSDPISISQVLGSPTLRNLIWLAHTYTVADALNFRKTLERVGRNAHQIRVADTVILNKCDLVSDTIPEIENQIKALNPFAKIIKTSYCHIDFKEDVAFHPPVGLALSGKEEIAKRPEIDSLVVKTTKHISAANLLLFVDKWSKTTFRIKGYVQTGEGAVAVQTSFERVEILRLPVYNYPTQIVILGPKLDDKAIQQEFESLCTRK
jgi:G3E family GTPase